MKLTSFPRLLTLGLCSAFIMASCSDDESVTDKNTTVKDEVLDDMQYSDESLISYIMSQFAELDENGNLVERTTYFRQLDESDTTAIYTIAESKESARAKFLSLLPESCQKKVVVKNDSSEMSLPIGTTPLQISYKEGGTDGNVVATVQLPSQGSYTKIANTLTMVKSFGENWDTNWDSIVCRFYKKKIKVLTTANPMGLKSQLDANDNLKVEEAELTMLCYFITEDGKAQYIFVPPFNDDKHQLQLPSGRYLLGIIRHWWIPGTLASTPDLKGLQKYFNAFPSSKMLSVFSKSICDFGDTHYNEPFLHLNSLANRYREQWIDTKLRDRVREGNYPKDSTEYYKGAGSYFDKMERFLTCGNKKGNGPQTISEMTDYFPFQPTEFKNYKDIPGVPQYVIDHGLPFFVNSDIFETKPEERTEQELIYSQSIASSQLYGRDEDNVVHTVSYYYGASGEWEVLEKLSDNKIYHSYFRPVKRGNSTFYEFKKYGRNLSYAIPSQSDDPLRVIYMYEEKLQ